MRWVGVAIYCLLWCTAWHVRQCASLSVAQAIIDYSAPKSAKFTCATPILGAVQAIASDQVNDGTCDCCDGTDEPAGVCPQDHCTDWASIIHQAFQGSASQRPTALPASVARREGARLIRMHRAAERMELQLRLLNAIIDAQLEAQLLVQRAVQIEVGRAQRFVTAATRHTRAFMSRSPIAAQVDPSQHAHEGVLSQILQQAAGGSVPSVSAEQAQAFAPWMLAFLQHAAQQLLAQPHLLSTAQLMIPERKPVPCAAQLTLPHLLSACMITPQGREHYKRPLGHAATKAEEHEGTQRAKIERVALTSVVQELPLGAVLMNQTVHAMAPLVLAAISRAGLRTAETSDSNLHLLSISHVLAKLPGHTLDVMGMLTACGPAYRADDIGPYSAAWARAIAKATPAESRLCTSAAVNRAAARDAKPVPTKAWAVYQQSGGDNGQALHWADPVVLLARQARGMSNAWLTTGVPDQASGMPGKSVWEKRRQGILGHVLNPRAGESASAAAATLLAQTAGLALAPVRWAWDAGSWLWGCMASLLPSEAASAAATATADIAGFPGKSLALSVFDELSLDNVPIASMWTRVGRWARAQLRRAGVLQHAQIAWDVGAQVRDWAFPVPQVDFILPDVALLCMAKLQVASLAQQVLRWNGVVHKLAAMDTGPAHMWLPEALQQLQVVALLQSNWDIMLKGYPMGSPAQVQVSESARQPGRAVHYNSNTYYLRLFDGLYDEHTSAVATWSHWAAPAGWAPASGATQFSLTRHFRAWRRGALARRRNATTAGLAALARGTRTPAELAPVLRAVAGYSDQTAVLEVSSQSAWAAAGLRSLHVHFICGSSPDASFDLQDGKIQQHELHWVIATSTACDFGVGDFVNQALS